MAGIGFRLRALVSRGSYLEAVAAYVSSAVITAGPWLSGVVALTILSMSAAGYLTGEDHAFLLATILIVFAASLLVAGGPQMVLTRYLADRVYANDMGSLAPTSTGVLFLLFPFARKEVDANHRSPDFLRARPTATAAVGTTLSGS